MVRSTTANGETYDNNKKAFYKYNTLNEFNANELVNKTYTMFMDQYGYFIGAELYSGKDQYVFITGRGSPHRTRWQQPCRSFRPAHRRSS